MKLRNLPLSKITQYARNPRKNAAAVAVIKASLKEYGWQQPIVVDKENVIVAGHTRYLAALELGLTEAPVHVADDLTPAQIKAYRLMDNKSHERAEWDMELLALEIEDLKEEGFDLDLTGFDAGELAGIALDEGDAETPADDRIDYKEHYSVLVECESETDQAEVFERLQGMGLTCKVLVN